MQNLFLGLVKLERVLRLNRKKGVDVSDIVHSYS